MDILRAISSIFIFSVSTYLVFDLFINGFNLVVFLVCICGYVLVHYLWPRKNDDESDWFDWLEVIVDLPYRSIALVLRSIGRGAKGNSDFDFD